MRQAGKAARCVANVRRVRSGVNDVAGRRYSEIHVANP